MPEFQKNLAFGQLAETAIALWLRSRGNIILPVYDIEYDTGKGPRLFSGLSKLVAPDLLVFGKEEILWAECKRKTVFSWYRKTSRWVTGIDLRHWRDYVQVQKVTGRDVWLFFLHERCTPDIADIRHNCPAQCPTGLYGNSLSILETSFSHQSLLHGSSGMIYWPVESLRLFAASLK